MSDKLSQTLLDTATVVATLEAAGCEFVGASADYRGGHIHVFECFALAVATLNPAQVYEEPCVPGSLLAFFMIGSVRVLVLEARHPLTAGTSPYRGGK